VIAPLVGRIPRPGWVFGGPRRYPGCYDRGAGAARGPLPPLRADCGALSGRKRDRCTHRDIGFFKRDEVRTGPRGKWDRSGAAKARKTTWPKFKGGRFGGDPPRSAHLGHGRRAKCRVSEAPCTPPRPPAPAHREPGRPARGGRVPCCGSKSPSTTKNRDLTLLYLSKQRMSARLLQRCLNISSA
jgi:hypothetical protein